MPAQARARTNMLRIACTQGAALAAPRPAPVRDGGILRTWDPARGMKLRSFISLVVRRYLCRRLRGFRGNPWSIDPTDAEELAAYLEGGTTTGAHSFTHTEYHRYLDEVLRILHGELNERDW